MLEEYLKRLEDIIVPHNYNKNNFREKIKAELEDPSEMDEIKKKREIVRASAQNRELVQGSEEEKKLLDEYIQKMGVSDESQKSLIGGKIKIYQKILDNEAEAVQHDNLEANENQTALRSKSGKTYSLSPSRTIKSHDEGSLREKIHMMNLKAMNYRYEIETLKGTICELKGKLDEQNLQIAKMDRQKETDNKYLIKLEGLLATKEPNGLNLSANKSKIISDKTLTSNFHSKSDQLVIDFNKSNHLFIEDKVNHTLVNFNDKNELKEFISNLIVENQKLKAFQNGVFDLSKKYDDVNENMIDEMKQIGQFLNLSKNEISIEEAPRKDIICKFVLILAHFEKLVENVEKTIEIKQSEYNFLLETKDQEVKFMSEEILKLNEVVEGVKRDRIRDQKIMNDYESEINFLSSRIEENNGKVSESIIKDENSILKLQVSIISNLIHFYYFTYIFYFFRKK